MTEKTIADKMYLKTAKSLAVLNGAAHPKLVEQLPPGMQEAPDAAADVVLLFARSQAELEAHLPAALDRLGDKGSLWIAFLKQSASKATDLTRDLITAYARQSGITDVAMVSLDIDWSALRLKRL